MCGFGIRGIHLVRPPSRPVAILSDLITFAQNTPVGSSKVPFAQRPPSDPWSPFMSLSLMNSCTQSPPPSGSSKSPCLFRPETPLGSSKSLSPRSLRRILEVPCVRFAQRPPSDRRSPFLYLLRPESSRRILQVPFSIAPRDPPVGSSKSLSPRDPPSHPRSPLL